MKRLLLIIMSVYCLFVMSGCTSKEKKEAISNYNKEVERIESEKTELETLIEQANTSVESSDKALDETLRTSLETAISTAKTVNYEVPKRSGDADHINQITEEVKKISYSSDIKNLSTAKVALDDSMKKYKLVLNPTEAYVIQCLKTIDGIQDISAVTEDHDPNGNLNKPGGYTATVYFTYELVDQSKVYGDTVIDKGTDGGGAVEVYANEDDATKRDEYLATFDGGILASGSHTVIASTLVRTSDELAASKQKDLENKIIEALTKLEE